MGLDFSHGGAHWGYIGFYHFRKRLAAAENITLDRMDGFEDMDYARDPRLPSLIPRSWDEVDTPIKDLLNHSDCEVELTPEQLVVIAPRLEEIVSVWPPDDRDRIQAERLIEGVRTCIRSGENLEFL